MSDPALLAAASDVAFHWATQGGPRSEFAIACHDGEVLAIADIPVNNRWDDAGRRAALGALLPLTKCTSFGYIADTTVTVDGEPSDALLCLELVRIDGSTGAIGAKTHMARYHRSKKRFGKDTIDVNAFVELTSAAYGALVEELTTVWHLDGDRGRLGAMTILSETGVNMFDVHPALQTELEDLLARQA